MPYDFLSLDMKYQNYYSLYHKKIIHNYDTLFSSN